MKRMLSLIVFVLAAAPLAPVLAQSPVHPGSETVPQNDEEAGAFAEPRHIALYMTPADVLAAMHGAPDEKLSPSIWVYYGFHPQGGPAVRRFDTLVVFFSPEQVYKFHLVERKALRQLLLDFRRTPTPRQPEMISEWPAPPRLGEVAPLVPPRRIALGMSPDDVARAMHGNPDAYLSPDIWVYWRFQASSNPGPNEPDTLIVFFSQGRVSHYKIVARQAVLPWLDGPAA